MSPENGDHESSLRRCGFKPNTCGGYHRPDYRVKKQTLILRQNVTRTHYISMSFPLAL